MEGGGVESMEKSVRRLRVVIEKKEKDIGKLINKLGIVMEEEWSVDDEKVDEWLIGILKWVIGKKRRIGEKIGGEKRREGEIEKDMKMIYGGWEESIEWRKNEIKEEWGKIWGKIEDGSGIEGEVEKEEEDKMGIVRKVELKRIWERGKKFLDLRDNDGEELIKRKIIEVK